LSKSEARIQFSVGCWERGARNSPADVRVVQTLLRQAARARSDPGMDPRRIDGLISKSPGGSDTVKAIEAFQRKVVRIARPDGVVEPNGRTMRELLLASQGARGKLPANLDKFRDIAQETVLTLKTEGTVDSWTDFLETVEQVSSDWDKVLFSITTGDAVRTAARFWVHLRKWGLTKSQINQLVRFMATGEGKWAGDWVERFVKYLGKSEGGLEKVVGKAAKAVDVVSYLTALIRVVVAWDKGDYHMVAVEGYKVYAGKIGWAAFVNGMQEFVSCILPDSAKSGFWKYLRVVDIVGLGGVAIDSYGVLVTCIWKREVDMARVTRLVERMNDSPAQIFAELGNNLGDAIYDISLMYKDTFDKATSSARDFMALVSAHSDRSRKNTKFAGDGL
jgi:hypothetical protein